MQLPEPWRHAGRSNRFPGAFRTACTVPVAVPAIIQALAIVQAPPFYIINTQPIVPMGSRMWRRCIAGVAFLCRRRTRRRRCGGGRRFDGRFVGSARRRRSRFGGRLGLIGTAGASHQQQRQQHCSAPLEQACSLAENRSHHHAPLARPSGDQGVTG